MSDPFVAEIRIVGFNFAPTGWALCNGQLLPISQNTALFSLLGTFYGGDGKSTFALPNFQGAFAMNQGQGPGLTERFLGEQGGSQFITLLDSEMAAHNHFAQANNAGTLQTPQQNVWSTLGATRTPPPLYAPAPPNTVMNPFAVTIAGQSLPHNNMSPYLVLNFVIAMQGIFPPRS